MIKKNQDGIKVVQNIRPLSYSKRVQPDLHIGHNYYVSFGDNNAYSCTLVEIRNEFDRTEVKIELSIQSKKGFIDSNGNLCHEWKEPHILYATEIGLNPNHAVKNQVG